MMLLSIYSIHLSIHLHLYLSNNSPSILQDSNTGRPYDFPILTVSTHSGTSPSGVPFSHNVTQLSTPKVVETAKNYYQCDTLTGVELEDIGVGTAGNHWELRQVGNEYMTGMKQLFLKYNLYHSIRMY